MELFSFVVASDIQKAPIIERGQSNLAALDSHNLQLLNREIDALIYQFYNLTSAEIAIVESDIFKKQFVIQISFDPSRAFPNESCYTNSSSENHDLIKIYGSDHLPILEPIYSGAK